MNYLTISENLRRMIIDEFNFAVGKMREKTDPLEKLFYYSAAYGILPRIFNQEFNPQLVHMHMILQLSYNTINRAVHEILSGMERVIKIPENYFEKLEDTLEELAEKMEKYDDVGTTLQKITNITYALIGNGYYLLQKGIPLL